VVEVASYPEAMTMSKAYQVVRDFEQAVCEYTGAPYCVAVDSCTNALFLSLMWLKPRYNLIRSYAVIGEVGHITIPRYTYLSVPQQIIHAGLTPMFEDIEWSGMYRLKPWPIYDSARRFTSGMYIAGNYMCTSHHWTKPLGIERGGCILHDDAEADKWFRRARFHGRAEGVPPKDDKNLIVGWNMMMLPSVAANGLVRLSHLSKNNPDLPNDDYPDLSRIRWAR
jgi:dTDP-4-amino-4,6-dideoxygalactose transaminase